jgi:acyl carrier protein
MNTSEIEEKTIKIIKNICFRQVEVNEPLISTKLLDSIVMVDLAVELENEFGISIPFVDINEQNFETVKAITHYIEVKTNN